MRIRGTEISRDFCVFVKFAADRKPKIFRNAPQRAEKGVAKIPETGDLASGESSRNLAHHQSRRAALSEPPVVKFTCLTADRLATFRA
jgi:hypothetical protein